MATVKLVVALAWKIAAAVHPMVMIPGLGSLRGVYLNDLAPVSADHGIAGFFGIPYAKAPLGDLRWRPPQAYDGPWAESTRDATNWGSKCLQVATPPTPPGANMSEDCLFLNVYAPSDAIEAKKRLPVLFWIHGGGFTEGSSNEYTGEGLVRVSKGSLIVVSINYRLGVFGFLGSKLLRGRSADGSFGNYGIQDQRMAMVWVRDHIAAFGGDTNQITIFGQSAGGMSVLNHLAQRASFALYSKAIVQSGAGHGAAIQLETAEAAYVRILRNISCSDIRCLVSAPAEKILAFVGGFTSSVKRLVQYMNTNRPLLSWGPVVDGVSLADDVLSLISRGSYNQRVPVMIGSCRDDVTTIADVKSFVPKDMDDVQLGVLLGEELRLEPAQVPEVRALYNPTNYSYPKDLNGFSQNWWTLMEELTDQVSMLGHCSVRSVARSLVAGGSHSVFVYLFAHQRAWKEYPSMVPHGADIDYTMNNPGFALHNMTSEARFAHDVASYWASFAMTGSPGSQAGIHWPKYEASRDELMALQAPDEGGFAVLGGHRKAACDYWEAQKQRPTIRSSAQSSPPLVV